MPYKHSDEFTGSDIGMAATGRDLKELFADSGYGLTEIMTDPKKLREDRQIKVEFKSDNLSELYYDWLSEIIYLKDAELFLLKRSEFSRLDEKKGILGAQLFGDTIDPKRHILKVDVKAVTYYKFKIEKTEEGWQSEVVFDL
ncbi:MAG TPA: archease [candidate division Zixibacteria bacterium]|nr:archease [candidate division Zixibacteria bacterium]